MRLTLLITAASLSLVACGDPRPSSANSADSNAINEAGPTAVSNTATPVPMSPVTGDQARALMHERHEGMETIGKANKAVRDQLQSSSPDLGIVRSNAARIYELSQKASGWFHAGTGPDIAKTGAKPEIWQNPQDFSAKLGNFQKATKSFQEAANGTDVTAMKAQLGPFGETCKACHDKYRSKMQH